ncbi:MAG: chitobiase/beta-hexosaminidase C-terminal domain-containing protein [Clostridiaceae bacterium]|nr:chitobiase/beta-hexosaminidase C-terminal domain-containing protein [Clostridiaceae bacterium]
MKRLIRKGFTLIELMIVIAIIAVLSVVLIPKAMPLKDQAKNNAVQANVYILRSFLENRAGMDKGNITNDLKTLPLTTALSNVQSKIKADMDLAFTGNNAIKNPFNNNSTIDISSSNVSSNINVGSASVIIGYDVNMLPIDVSGITNSVITPGVTVIIVYPTGYVVYGVDKLGAILQPTLVNMPNRVAQLPVTNTTTTPQVATPTFDNTGGTYKISCVTTGATIRYTTDGTEPTSSSLVYNNIPFTVANATTIKAFAVSDGLLKSDVASITYTAKVETPIFSYAFDNTGGSYTINCGTTDATIFYTTDGTLPDETSNKYIYGTAIEVTTNSIITAYAIYSEMADSDVASVTYTAPSLNYALTYKNFNFMSVWYKPAVTCTKVILHYNINSGSQVTVNLNYNNSSGKWESGQINLSSKLKSNDKITYFFTYTSGGSSVNTPSYVSTY